MGMGFMRKLNMDELGRKTVKEFKQAIKNPVIAVLDNIRSMHNVGSVFRTADAFSCFRHLSKNGAKNWLKPLKILHFDFWLGCLCCILEDVCTQEAKQEWY